jgi:hypothetical protein
MNYTNPEFLPKLAEWHVYGNEQQGRFLTKYPEELNPTFYGTEVTLDVQNNIFKRQLGKKSYELKDHLGNVRVTFSDIKMPTGTPAQPFRVDLLSKSEYYPGGMPILDLSYQLENKRYGYNSGAEVDREIFSQKDRAFSTLFREGDTYTLRWWSQDPKRNEFPHQSTYSYMDANPILKNDPLGDKGKVYGTKAFLKQVVNNLQKLTDDKIFADRNGNLIYAKTTGVIKKNTGTQLVRSIIDSKEEVQIKQSKGKNKTNVYNPDNANVVPLEKDGKYKLNTGNDVNVTVLWDPLKLDGGLDETSSKNRPPFIGLGHELIHAKNSITGNRQSNIPTNKLDPDGSGEKLDQEEINTRKEENKLRNENNIPLRVLPDEKK